jgi:hypothetical protein
MRVTFIMITLLMVFTLALVVKSWGQENIALGEWRIHASYNRINSVSIGNSNAYAASSNGIVVLNKNENNFLTLDKLNAITKSGISTIAFHDQTNQLIIAYRDGTFDVVRDDHTRNFDPSQNTVLTGPKNIHDITFNNSLAYLSTDYGVLIFDLNRSEIKETWRDLGPAGSTFKILESTFYNDSVFLATANGIMAGDLDDNLLDFNNWKRFTDAELNNEVSFINTFDNTVYAVVNGVGIYTYSNNSWTKKDFLQGKNFSVMNASSQHLLLAQDNNIYLIDIDDEVSQVNHPLIRQVMDAQEDDSGTLWIGDFVSGFVTNAYGAFESIVPNGPGLSEAFDLRYSDNKMYLVSGGYSPEDTPLQREGIVSYFENGRWYNFTEGISDITSIVFSPQNDLYLGSFGWGVLEKKPDETTTLYDESNSTLINKTPPERTVYISALHYSTDGLWVANYGAIPALHLLNTEKNWQSFTFPFVAATYPVKLLTDLEENVWMLLNPEHGGGIMVFDKETNESFYLTENDGSGELPSRSVYSLAIDRDGYVWAGTDGGVAYFYDEKSDAVKPIFENRFLLRDEKVTAIAVDGGNRKWMGTERGVWLINPTGEIAIANFTAQNSPLLSDTIVDIEIHPVTGEVFFATTDGVISYRSDATESRTVFEEIKIFPNPVANNFAGQVGISGLATDAVVKITDVSGKLVYQTIANGGTASWNVRDHQGRRVPTGIFLVFAVKGDGSESIVGKIAVVN